MKINTGVSVENTDGNPEVVEFKWGHRYLVLLTSIKIFLYISCEKINLKKIKIN